MAAPVVMVMALCAGTALAADKVRVGKPEAKPFQFAPVEVGIETGIFAKHGIEVESIGFGGASRMHQAMTAHNLEISIGSGPEMAMTAKGAPEIAVAAAYGPPNGLCVIVLPNSPIRSVKDLKGKTIGISSPSGLTAWAARELGRSEGWGADGIKAISLGAQEGIVGGVLSGNIDSAVTATENAETLQRAGRVRILANFGDIVPHFIAHVIFASNDFVANNPDALRRFLKGWFETIAFMQSNKAETVRITSKVVQITPEIAALTYDEQIKFFSTDGRFEAKALKVVEGTFLELGFLDHAPDMKTLYTEAYLPK
jgi:ABC-type nitrate/sulfonate/bicarbonate transport system substrate-binding protein